MTEKPTMTLEDAMQRYQTTFMSKLLWKLGGFKPFGRVATKLWFKTADGKRLAQDAYDLVVRQVAASIAAAARSASAPIVLTFEDKPLSPLAIIPEPKGDN